MYKASCAHVCSTWKKNIQANFMWNFHGKFISHEVHACALYSCKCNVNIFHLVRLQGAPSDGTDTDHGVTEDHAGLWL